MPVENERANVLATGRPYSPGSCFLHHMDTVPPFINSSEDGDRIYGRGACDARGLSPSDSGGGEAAPVKPFVGLLFLVGEERDSIGAKAANQQPIARAS